MRSKQIIWLVIFSISMGYMESAVVVYLRAIYYPGGFRFPLVPLDSAIAQVEIFREAATILMLLGIGVLSGRSGSTKFARFIFCFAIWDLSYYFFLWLILGWPESVLTWDILFLIPVPWVGPVIAPVIISLTMIVLALNIFRVHGRGVKSKLISKEWLLFITGSMVVIFSFTWDYLIFLKKNDFPHGDLTDMKHYVPAEFNWLIFLAGELILLFGIFQYFSRTKKTFAVD